MKKVDNFNASKWLVENKITTQSKLNEEKSWVEIDAEIDAKREAEQAEDEKFLTTRMGKLLTAELKQMASQPFGTEEVSDIVQDLQPTPRQLKAAGKAAGLEIYGHSGGYDFNSKNWKDDGAMLNYYSNLPHKWEF